MNAAGAVPTTRPANAVMLAAALILTTLHAAWLCAVPTHDDTTALTPNAVRLRLNPNTATAAQWRLLPGIGEVLSARIVTHTAALQADGGVRWIEDLDAVPGLGTVRLGELAPHLVFDDTPGVHATKPGETP